MEARVPASHIRPSKILVPMNNARLHHAKIAQQQLKDLETEWLPHPPNSSDVSPCDFNAFRSLENFCRGQHFKNRKDVAFAKRIWIAIRFQDFRRRGLEQLLEQLLERWRTIVKTRGKCHDDRRNASIVDTCHKVKILRKYHYLRVTLIINALQCSRFVLFRPHSFQERTSFEFL